MGGYFEVNVNVLAQRSPETAVSLRALVPDGSVRTLQASSGAPLVECRGRLLESQRDPVGAARRVADTVEAPRVVVAGFGAGYLGEALAGRGIEVAAIVEADPQVLRAALQSRDLRDLLARTRVVLTGETPDPVALAALRADADTIVAHGPSMVNADLAALVERWPRIRTSSRRPRVLVVGPIYGGSLGIATTVGQTFAAAGANTRYFDASVFAAGHHALQSLAGCASARLRLQGELAALLGSAVVEVAREWKPDLVFALAQAPLDHRSLDGLRASGATTAFWFVENGRVLTYWKDIAPAYDWFYAFQPGRFLSELADAGARAVRYLPVACDPAVHRPVELTEDERRRFAADISFAGSPYLNRRRMFAGLTDLPFRIWGPGWDDPMLAPLVAEGGRAFSTEEMVRIFAASRINVNLHSAQHVAGCDPRPDCVNPRTFELAACGAFQLVDRRDPLPDLFAHDEVVTFGDTDDLRRLIAHYLARDDERLEIAQRARMRVGREHTYAHRIERVLRETLAPELAAATRREPSEPTLTERLRELEQREPELTEEEACLHVLREVQLNWAHR